MSPKTRVLVTGCSTGAGRGLAIEFAARGCEVLATARNLDSMADLATMEGISIARVDVCEPESLSQAVAGFGAVDVAVANAGFSNFGPLIEQELSTIDKVLRTNVLGVMATAQAVAPSMMERKRGVIVVVGSVSARLITPYAGAYCGSKAAIRAMCDAMRMELAPFNIHVQEVIAGAIRSSFGATALAGSQLPDSSRYKPLQPFIDARAMGSQGPSSMEPADWAKIVVDAALAPSPKETVLAGGMSLKYHLYGNYFPSKLWAKQISAALGLTLLTGPLPADGQPIANPFAAATSSKSSSTTRMTLMALAAGGVAVLVMRGLRAAA